MTAGNNELDMKGVFIVGGKVKEVITTSQSSTQTKVETLSSYSTGSSWTRRSLRSWDTRIG